MKERTVEKVRYGFTSMNEKSIKETVNLFMLISMENEKSLVVSLFVLLPILLLTGSNNLQKYALICHIPSSQSET